MEPSELHEYWTYDPETGEIRWRVNRYGHHGVLCAVAGNIATYPHPRGYRVIRTMVEGVQHRFLAHRAAWAMMTGRWPAAEIDHRNGVKDDNRFANLQEATSSQNKGNVGIRRNNKSGFKGVCWDKKKQKWRASIVRRHVGYFDDPAAAHAAYLEAAAKHFGQFARIR